MKSKTTKKKHNWTTLLTFKREYFTIIEHQSFNELTLVGDLNEVAVPHEIKTISRTPFVKDKDNFRVVDVVFFTPKDKWSEGSPVIDEKTWIDKSLDIFSSAMVSRVTVALEKNEDKIKLSLFRFSKQRRVGHKYFSKRSDDLHITFNTTTKNFFITDSRFLNRKRSTVTTKNDFMKIISVLNPLSTKGLLSTDGYRENQQQKDIDNEELILFMKQIEKTLQKELKVKNDLSYFGEGMGKLLMDWFVKVRKIKVPNDYYYYLSRHYPGIRKLNKFKMNLGRAILDNKNLVGKYYIKLINTHGGYNLNDLVMLKITFGENHTKLIPKNFLKISANSSDSKQNLEANPIDHINSLKSREKLNLIKVIKEVDDPFFISQIFDHIYAKKRLNGLGLEKNINCTTLNQFNQEHQNWAELINLCERNEETTYHYQNNFINEMEKNMIVKENTYKVKVLDSDLEYFNEGQVQSHCVRTYLSRYDSIVVSVRQESLNSVNRMTCEFKHGELNISQTRMKHNKLPVGDWLEVTEKLEVRYKEFCLRNTLEKPKIEIYNRITNMKYDGYKSDRGVTYGNIAQEDLPF